MSLKVVGQHRGLISLDLANATVLDLKKAVSAASGLPVAGLKLLAGGKHLKDDASRLAQSGVTAGKTIMVLRQDLSAQVEAEAGLKRRTEEAVQAASLLSARAARDIGSGGRGDAWGQWGRGNGGGGGGAGRGAAAGGRGGTGGGHGRREIELTNQDGEAVAIPPGDSAALMEGMMLHRQGLACMTRTRKRTSATETRGAAAAAAAAAAAVASTTPGKASLAAESPPVDGSQSKKARRRPMTLPQEQQRTVVGDGSGGSVGGVGAGERGEGRSGGHEKRKGETDVGSSATLEKKDEEGQDRGELEGKASTTTRKTVGVDGSNGAQGSGDVMEVDEDAGTADKGMKDASIGGAAHSSGFPLAADGSLPPLPSSGKAGPSGGDGTAPKQRRLELSASEKLMAQREALGLLMRADEAFQRCDPKYLDAVDNYAYLCLDTVWLLFLMKDMKNLDLASSKLSAVEKGFRKAHGEGLQRLTALKGEYCAEKLLYVRLHLLQGVVAFLRGDLGKASALLLRASAEAKALRPNPALAARLMQQWHTVKFEVLQPKLALRALRVGRNDLDAAWQYLENLWQRKESVRKERRRRAERRRHGLTANKGSYVDGGLIDQLAQAGFPRLRATRALRKHNNDIAAALAFLTTGEGGRGPGTNGGGGGGGGGNNDEALAVLQSLGVPPDAARDVLGRTGTLCDALRELGIDAPEGTVAAAAAAAASSPAAGGVGGGGGARGSTASTSGDGNGGGDGNTGDGDGSSEEEGEAEARRGGPEESEPTAEEKRLFDELAADRENQDNEGYLDVTLEDEADAADMYLLLCRGNIPVTFDLDKVRAGVAASAAAKAAAEDAKGDRS